MTLSGSKSCKLSNATTFMSLWRSLFSKLANLVGWNGILANFLQKGLPAVFTYFKAFFVSFESQVTWYFLILRWISVKWSLWVLWNLKYSNFVNLCILPQNHEFLFFGLNVILSIYLTFLIKNELKNVFEIEI